MQLSYILYRGRNAGGQDFIYWGGAGGGGKLPPQTLQLPPKKVLTINTISNKNSGFMFFRALVIDTQKWAQKLCMLHTQLIFAHNLPPPQTKNPR